MLLVIYSLEGGQTHIHILWTKSISRKQASAGLRLVHTWFKKA